MRLAEPSTPYACMPRSLKRCTNVPSPQPTPNTDPPGSSIYRHYYAISDINDSAHAAEVLRGRPHPSSKMLFDSTVHPEASMDSPADIPCQQPYHSQRCTHRPTGSILGAIYQWIIVHLATCNFDPYPADPIDQQWANKPK